MTAEIVQFVNAGMLAPDERNALIDARDFGNPYHSCKGKADGLNRDQRRAEIGARRKVIVSLIKAGFLQLDEHHAGITDDGRKALEGCQ